MGINIGPFTSNGDPIDTAYTEDNVVLRGGSYGYGLQGPGIGAGTTAPDTAVTGVTLAGNKVVNPIFDGMDVRYIDGASIQNNTIDSPNLDGFNVLSSAEGSTVTTSSGYLSSSDPRAHFGLMLTGSLWTGPSTIGVI